MTFGIDVKDATCLCDKDLNHIEATDTTNNWRFWTGQCCSCLNIEASTEGATVEDLDSDDEDHAAWAEENLDYLHICDLDAFIEALKNIRDAINGTATRAPANPHPQNTK